MDIQKIINIIKRESSTARLYFTKKTGNKYTSYSPTIDGCLQKDIKDLISKYLDSFIGIEQVDFSPLGYREETIEVCKTEYINNYRNVVMSYENNVVNREIPDDIINKLNFYCLVIEFNEDGEDKEILLFRRVTKFKKLSTKGFMGWISDNRFKKLDTSLIGIDGDVDLIIYGNEVLILSHISLERIFSISDQYQEKAKEAIELIRVSDRIINFEQFEEDAINDGRITRTLTKLLNEEERMQNCFENFENVTSVINVFDLDIKIQISDGIEKILYESKEQLMDIIRLVRDSYYRSIINDRKGIDDSL